MDFNIKHLLKWFCEIIGWQNKIRCIRLIYSKVKQQNMLIIRSSYIINTAMEYHDSVSKSSDERKIKNH